MSGFHHLANQYSYINGKRVYIIYRRAKSSAGEMKPRGDTVMIVYCITK